MKTIQTRLILSFLLIIILLFIQGLVAYHNIRSLLETQQEAYTHQLQIKDYANRLASTRLLVFRILGTMDPDQMDAFQEQFQSEEKRFKAALINEGIEKSLVDGYFDTYEEIIALHYDFRRRTAQKRINQESKRLHEAMVHRLRSHGQVVEKASQNKIRRTYQKTLYFTFGILGAALVIALLLAFILARNLIDRQQAEEELRASEAKYRSIMDNASVVIFIKDMNGKYLFINKRFENKHDITNDNIQGLTDFDIFPPELADQFRRNDFEVLQSSQPQNIEEQVPYGDGIHIVISTKFPLRDLDGKAYAMCGIATDITERKKAEREIIQQKERAERYLNLAGVMFIGLDADGNVTLANQKACKILECAEKDIIGYNWFDNFIPPAINTEVRGVFNQLMAGDLQPVEYFENRVVSKSGLEKIIAWHNTYIFDDHGQIVGTLSSGEDITDKKQLEAHLQQAQKMEAIGNLAGGIAHDFNNILFPIIGLAELLIDDLPAGSVERENAAEILKSAQRAGDLVQQILAFSRQSAPQQIPIRVQQILKEVLKLCRATIPADIEIGHDIQKDCGLVMADPAQLHQIAMNLVTNAYHALGEDGGSIFIHLKDVELDKAMLADMEMQPGRYAMLSVADTGCGIQPAIMEKIFDPYFTTKGHGKGTGLGLAVVYGIVKALGGNVNVYSEMGQGTTFNVYLPLIEKHEETDPIKDKPENLAIGTERVLLVDDEEAVMRLEKKMLERMGYTVTAFTSSIDALEAFREAPALFDLVLSDMTMPNMTGDRLARELITIRPDIPIIICTGFSERINQRKAAEIGIRGFLMKPVVKSDMAQLVRSVLDAAEDPS
ncbi:MAG: PAS domain S-box protein [Thermodesulfobacteriota bacterium]|nr:PAS domain S-box protein [Thermodesulfobacteriota bacterium]